MFELLTISTGLVICLSAVIAYSRSRDPLCPLVVISPLLGYVYAYRPYVLWQSGELFRIFPDSERLEFVQFVNLVGVTAFCVGCNWHQLPQRVLQIRGLKFNNPVVRNRVVWIGMVLGAISIAVFLSMLWATGPSVFTTRKPYLLSPIRSGYFRELTNLSFPAALIAAIGWSGTRVTFKKMLVLVAMLAPIIFMATIGGRRGPLFLSAATIAACVFIIRQRRINPAVIVGGVMMLGLMMLFLQLNRANLFRFWDYPVDTSLVSDSLRGTGASNGDEFVAAASTILACRNYERHFWGRRYLVMYFVRPIPHQLWPTKYEDCGMGWMKTAPGSNGFSPVEWQNVVGFVPAGGSAGGFISDMFLEFQLGMVLAAFLIGMTFNVAWWRSIVRGNLWKILYFELLILSVYLPSQSVGAWLYRAMLIIVPTAVMWRYFISPILARRHLAGPRRPARYAMGTAPSNSDGEGLRPESRLPTWGTTH